MVKKRIFQFVLFLLLINVKFSGAVMNTDTPITVNAHTRGADLISFNITGSEYKTSQSGTKAVISLSDGVVSEFWTEVVTFSTSALGGEGKIASVYGENDIYFYIEYAYTKDFKWIGFQWDGDSSMDPENFIASDFKGMDENDDMWFFGESEQVVTLGDGHAIGLSPPFVGKDVKNDLYWERVLVNDTDNNPFSVVYEIRRSLNTGDVDGKDVVFSTATNTTFLLSTDVNHQTNNNCHKLTLTNERVGGDIPVQTSEKPTGNNFDGSKVLRNYIITGVIYMVVAAVALFIPSYIIMKKEEN